MEQLGGLGTQRALCVSFQKPFFPSLQNSIHQVHLHKLRMLPGDMVLLGRDNKLRMLPGDMVLLVIDNILRMLPGDMLLKEKANILRIIPSLLYT